MGWVLLILLLLFLLPFFWVLYAPIIFHVETDRNIYFVEARPLLRVSFYQPEQGIGVWVKFIPFNWEFQPKLGSKKRKERDKKEESDKKARRRWRPKWSKLRSAIIKAIREIGFSFKVHTFKLNLDTDDYTLNAKLYPAFVILDSNSGNNYAWNINFEGQNSLTLIVQNRLSRFVWIGIKTFFRII